MARSKRGSWLTAGLAMGLVCSGVLGGAAAQAQTDLLPDIIIRQSDLYDNDIITSGGQRLLRLSNATPNIGAGKLYVYGGQTYPDGTQDVIQRIYRTDGSFSERLSGKFVYHPGHGHIHFENWCQYNLRTILPGDGVGPIVAQGAKTSFCILDLGVHDSSLPGFPPGGQFRSCGSTIQGLSVGWLDIYSKTLSGQNIVITGVPAGQYWLESVADPANNVLESNEDNNATRIKVTIPSGGGGTINPDPYEPNDSRGVVDGRPVGQLSSPNLGPCNPTTTITGLTLHAAGNDDYFRFYNPGTGVSGDQVRINFTHASGDVDLQLLNASGSVVDSSTGTGDSETISLSGRGRGWYYVRVFGFSGATCPSYSLTINPAASAAPAVTVIDPPAGDIVMIHGEDAYPVVWSASDPDGDPTWVTLYVNDTPSLDGAEILIPSSLHTPGADGTHIINSAYVPEGTYYVYAQITDGGTTTGGWSAGTLTWTSRVCEVDLNQDGFVDFADYLVFLTLYDAQDDAADLNSDGFVDFADYLVFLDLYDQGC